MPSVTGVAWSCIGGPEAICVSFRRPAAIDTTTARRLSMPLLPITWNLEGRRDIRGLAPGNGKKRTSCEGEDLDQQRSVQQEERRGTRRYRRRRWPRTECLEVVDDRQNDAGREEGRRIDIGVGAKGLTGAAVSGLVTAALGMILAVCRYSSGMSVNRRRADMAEHDEDRHTDEQ